MRLLEPCGPQPPAAEARKYPAVAGRAPQAAPDIPYMVSSDGASFARAGCEGRSCGREPAPAQGRMSIHWSQAPRQAGMYSRRSGWGAGGSLNLPDRTGTSAFLNRAQHQVNRILLPKQENISERDRGPCHSGSEGLPHRTERSGPGTWPAALRTSESRDFPNMLMRKSPPHPSILPSARRLAGMQDYFRTSVCALSKAGFYNRPASQPAEHARQTG